MSFCQTYVQSSQKGKRKSQPVQTKYERDKDRASKGVDYGFSRPRSKWEGARSASKPPIGITTSAWGPSRTRTIQRISFVSIRISSQPGHAARRQERMSRVEDL